MHQEYLPQLDEPPNFMDSVNTLEMEPDSTNVFPDFTDEGIISICLSSSALIAEICSFLYNNGEKSDREILQSIVALHPIMAAAAVQLWAQHTQQLQGDENSANAHKEHVELFSMIINSWQPQWPVACAFEETLNSVRRLYESSYLTSPWNVVRADATASISVNDAGLEDVVETSPPAHNIETANPTQDIMVAEGSGLPDPDEVCQQLYDKIRYTMLTSLEAPDVKRRMLNSYLRTLWIHVWKSTGTEDLVFEDLDFLT